MTFFRPWLLFFVAGFLLGRVAVAQDNAGAAPAGAAGNAGGAAPAGAAGNGAAPAAPGTPAAPATPPGGASSSFGTPAASPAAPASGTTPTEGTSGAGVPVPPGESGRAPGGNIPDTSTFHSGTDQSGTNPNGAAAGSASSFGTGEGTGGPQLHQAPATFTVPGFYGRGAQQFTVGEGRLARPRFRVTADVSVGYDDNVFQTPTNPQGVPEQQVQVLKTPGEPATSTEVVVPSGDPSVPAMVETVPVPAVKPKFHTIIIPAVPPPERIGSWVTKTDARVDAQMASRRTLFTFDLGGGVDYYWNRPGKKEEYTGNLSLIYLQKLTGRLQFTLAVDSSYQSQPDFSQPNLPTSSNVGAYLSSNAKADVSYRLTPRFSAVTSVTYSTLNYQEQVQSSGNYATTTFGTELSYLFSPTLTLLGELRYSSDSHPDASAEDTTSYVALLGGELKLSKRFTASLKVGEAVQTFRESGDRSSSPHIESTVAYRLGEGTTFQWNGLFGYEEASAANTQNLVARSGLQATQIFSPRMQGTLGLNLVHSDSKATSGVTADTVQDTIDATLGLYYTLNRHWSFNLTYSYTLELGPVSTADYYRQRVFLGASYQF